VTMHEALEMFDEVEQTESGPVARCCVLPVVMDSQNGTPKLYCITCGRTVTNVWREGWVVTDWGSKGINLSGCIKPGIKTISQV
jgi:hypothetical protein